MFRTYFLAIWMYELIGRMEARKRELRWRSKHFGSTPAGDAAEPRTLASCAKTKLETAARAAAAGQTLRCSGSVLRSPALRQSRTQPARRVTSALRSRRPPRPLVSFNWENPGAGKLGCRLDPPTLESFGPPGVLERRSLVGCDLCLSWVGGLELSLSTASGEGGGRRERPGGAVLMLPGGGGRLGAEPR